MYTLGVILARGGSKRLPGKNVRPLAGKPHPDIPEVMLRVGVRGRVFGSSGALSGRFAIANDTVVPCSFVSSSWKSSRCAFATRSCSSRCAVISVENNSRMYAPS